MQLPLPYLKVGYLTVAPASNALSPHRDWVRSQFILNHEELQQVILSMLVHYCCTLAPVIFILGSLELLMPDHEVLLSATYKCCKL
jgi:hypothetical protein